MKLDAENMVVLKAVMKSLSEGVDPTSNIAFPDDTILKSKLLQSCFASAYEIFDYLERNVDIINTMPPRKAANQKLPFSIGNDEFQNIQLSDTPITISKFVFFINAVCHRNNMKKLKATQITSWLTAQGYLEEIETKDGCICKSATAHGEKIGITPVKKINSRGEEYITNMYNRDAQEFILSHVVPKIHQSSLPE